MAMIDAYIKAELIYSTMSSPNLRTQKPKKKVQKITDCKAESDAANQNLLKFINTVLSKRSTYSKIYK